MSAEQEAWRADRAASRSETRFRRAAATEHPDNMQERLDKNAEDIREVAEYRAQRAGARVGEGLALGGKIRVSTDRGGQPNIVSITAEADCLRDLSDDDAARAVGAAVTAGLMDVLRKG